VSTQGKIVAAIVGTIIPLGVIGADIAFFSSNPLTMVGALTALSAGALYLLTYTEHE
jgi:hypothetical protein